MFIKLGIVYGSKESVLLINNLMPFIFTESLVASSELAKIRGSFLVIIRQCLGCYNNKTKCS